MKCNEWTELECPHNSNSLLEYYLARLLLHIPLWASFGEAAVHQNVEARFLARPPHHCRIISLLGLLHWLSGFWAQFKGLLVSNKDLQGLIPDYIGHHLTRIDCPSNQISGTGEIMERSLPWLSLSFGTSSALPLFQNWCIILYHCIFHFESHCMTISVRLILCFLIPFVLCLFL